MKLFKMNRIVDERIQNMENKITREAYNIAMLIALTSIIVKFHLYGINTKTVIPEVIIIFVPSLYYVIKSAFLGIYSDEVEMHDRTSKIPMSVKNIIIGLVSGIVLAGYFGIRSAVLYGKGSNKLWYFILVFFVSLMIYCPLITGIIFLGDMSARKAGKKSKKDDQE